jgi:hypothetical protein
LRKFRHILSLTLLVAGIFCIITDSGCKNKCGGTTCQNGGTCSDNVCICPVGYSGNACQTGWTTPIIGTYNCKNENCNPVVVSTSTWQSAITVASTDGGYTVNISDFDGQPINVLATVDSFDSIYISSGTTGGIDGTGSYNPTSQTINLKFTTSSAGLSYQCRMLLTKIQ